MTVGFGFVVTNTAKFVGIILSGVIPRKENCLIALKSGRFVYRLQIQTPRLHVAFGTKDKEGRGLMECVKTLKVEVASIHNIEGSGICSQNVEDIDIVDFAICNFDESGDRASQVQ